MSSKFAPVGILALSLVMYVVFGDASWQSSAVLTVLLAVVAAYILTRQDGATVAPKAKSASAGSPARPASAGSGKGSRKGSRIVAAKSSSTTSSSPASSTAPSTKDVGQDAAPKSSEPEEKKKEEPEDESPCPSPPPSPVQPEKAPGLSEVSAKPATAVASSGETAAVTAAPVAEPAKPAGDKAADAAAAGTDGGAVPDSTVKASQFWQSFGVQPAVPERAPGEPVDPVADSQNPLPASLADYSSAGVVKKGHIDIDSEDEADEELADTVISGSSRFDIGFADTKGKRVSMEDEMVIYGTFRDHADEDYVAVFDGHGGAEASAVAAEELHEMLATHLEDDDAPATGEALRRAFISCQKTIEEQDPQIQAGTTAVVAYIKGNTVYVANAGDSRAVRGSKKGAMPDSKVTPPAPADAEEAAAAAKPKHADVEGVVALRITTDHKPSLPSEEARIKEAGGFVTRTMTKRGEISRVCAILGVARALGDVFLQPMVTCVPDVFEFGVDESQILILACDGLWDVVDDDEAVAVALAVNDPGEAARRLRDLAYHRRSEDNISILVLDFRSH